MTKTKSTKWQRGYYTTQVSLRLDSSYCEQDEGDWSHQTVCLSLYVARFSHTPVGQREGTIDYMSPSAVHMPVTCLSPTSGNLSCSVDAPHSLNINAGKTTVLFQQHPQRSAERELSHLPLFFFKASDSSSLLFKTLVLFFPRVTQ